MSKVGEIGSAVYLVVDRAPTHVEKCAPCRWGKDRGRNDSRKPDNHADVAELEYAPDLKSGAQLGLRVRISSSAPTTSVK